MKKSACYYMTRNLYGQLLPSLKSLLLHSDVDTVYLLIEDDYLPYPLPPMVKCVNVSGQTWFTRDSPNYNSQWSYMVLMRAALPYILPEEDFVLSLDLDTIAVDDISALWDYHSDDCYVAGVPEPAKSKEGKPYINFGVALLNLKKLREDGKAEEIITALNTRKFQCAEQDAYNELCAGHVLEIPSDYNASRFSAPTIQPKLLHFAAEQYWQNYPIVKAYEAYGMDFNREE